MNHYYTSSTPDPMDTSDSEEQQQDKHDYGSWSKKREFEGCYIRENTLNPQDEMHTYEDRVDQVLSRNL